MRYERYVSDDVYRRSSYTLHLNASVANKSVFPLNEATNCSLMYISTGYRNTVIHRCNSCMHSAPQNPYITCRRTDYIYIYERSQGNYEIFCQCRKLHAIDYDTALRNRVYAMLPCFHCRNKKEQCMQKDTCSLLL